MVCVRGSISHTWHNQSSTHHWQSNISCSVWPIERNSKFWKLAIETFHICWKNNNVYYSFSFIYLWGRPLHWHFSSLGNIGVIHHIARHPKITYLWLICLSWTHNDIINNNSYYYYQSWMHPSFSESIMITLSYFMYTSAIIIMTFYTLHILSLETRIFLAARSLWTKDLLAR